jgi:hypothetical protein
MKKTILLTLVLATIASYAFAQSGSSWVITPATQGPVASNSSFTVNLAINGAAPPSPLDGFDLWIVTSGANSGLFTIASATYSAPFTNPGATRTFNDPINAATDSAFVVNTTDLGNVSVAPGSDPSAPYSNLPLMTLTINTGVLAPNTTYSFFTSTAATATNVGAGFSRFSDFLDQSANTFTTTATQFDITTATGIPEPATWSLLGLGGLGSFGLTFLRARRKS